MATFDFSGVAGYSFLSSLGLLGVTGNHAAMLGRVIVPPGTTAADSLVRGNLWISGIAAWRGVRGGRSVD